MNDTELVDTIQQATSGQLSYAFDAVGPGTAGLCLQAMNTGKSNGNKTLVALAGIPKHAKTAARGGQPVELSKGIFVNMPEIKVKVFHNDPEFGQELLRELTTYLINGQLRVSRIKIMDGGLEDVNKGLSLLKEGQISGSKLVIRVDRTPDAQGDLHYHGWL
jgi:Zn-dependent alcohol dehydrogenase